jgi:alpha-1,2-mannosyltransferase
VAAGFVLLVVYNTQMFGSPSISGGYGSGFSERAASGNLLWFAGNILGGLFDAHRGLLIWSPFLVVLAAGLPAAWRAATPWVRWSAVGGVMYLLLQYKANRFSGGDGFYGYRYPLDAMTAASPLLFLAYVKWVVERPARRRWFVAMAAVAITLQVVLALR